MRTRRILQSLLAAMTAGVALAAHGPGRGAAAGTRIQPLLGDEGPMPELKGDKGWLNSAPFSTKSLRGKVVVVDIWTYS